MHQKKANPGKTENHNEIRKADHLIQDFKAQAAKAEAQGDWKTAAKYY